MKKSRLFSLLPLICAFALTSCDMLSNFSFNTPKRKSSEEPDNALVNSRSSIEEPPSLIEPERPMSSSSYTSSYHKHNFSDWVVVQDATCLEDGIKERYCVECGYTETQTINKLNHSWGSWFRVVEPTCTETGLEERVCSRCDARESRTIMANGHYYEDYAIISQPTCISNGIKEVRCIYCGEVQQQEIPASGHIWGRSDIIQETTCEKDGRVERTCSVCGVHEEEIIPAYGHDIELVDYQGTPESGKSPVRLYKCRRCDVTYLGFKATDVTEESKSHLVFDSYYDGYGEAGASFWGRPIGNALALSSDGVSVNQQNDECVYCSTETGDYFEYAFDLTEEQAALLSNCRLYCDAKPANYLNGTDFWAYGRSNTDWTPGYYIDGDDERFETNEDGSFVMVNDHARAGRDSQQGVELDTKVKLGKRIEGYRYVLYVDGNVVDFDPDTACPTHGSNTNMQREEFELPYTFHLHQGENRISLHMAGGYRSTFYNFIFRPYVEPTPVTVNETALEIREGKTAKITSSMTGLTYKSSSNSVCTVDVNGVVTGVKAGTATITVSKEGNYKDAKVAVTVLEKEGIVTLQANSGVIGPDADSIEVYTSSYIGTRLRNFKKDSTLTFTFQSELAGLFDITFNARGSNVIIADNISVKVNGADVVVSGQYNSANSGVDTVIGQAELKVGENVMVITTISENSPLQLHYVTFAPHDYKNVIKTWSCEDLEANRTDSGWADSRDFDEAGKAFKFNKVGSVNLTYVSESAQKVMLQLKLAVKQSNNTRTYFWKQNDVEKTRITVNGAALEAGAEPDFSGSIASSVNDSGIISVPEWYKIIEIDLVAGENTIQIEYLAGGYAYYLGGIALVK